MNLETSSFAQVLPTTAPKDVLEDAIQDALMLAQVAPARAPVNAGDVEIRAMPSAPMTVRMGVKEHAAVRAPIIARVVARILVKAHVSTRVPIPVGEVAPARAVWGASSVVMTLVLEVVSLVVRAVVKVVA